MLVTPFPFFLAVAVSRAGLPSWNARFCRIRRWLHISGSGEWCNILFIPPFSAEQCCGACRSALRFGNSSIPSKAVIDACRLSARGHVVTTFASSSMKELSLLRCSRTPTCRYVSSTCALCLHVCMNMQQPAYITACLCIDVSLQYVHSAHDRILVPSKIKGARELEPSSNLACLNHTTIKVHDHVATNAVPDENSDADAKTASRKSSPNPDNAGKRGVSPLRLPNKRTRIAK